MKQLFDNIEQRGDLYLTGGREYTGLMLYQRQADGKMLEIEVDGTIIVGSDGKATVVGGSGKAWTAKTIPTDYTIQATDHMSTITSTSDNPITITVQAELPDPFFCLVAQKGSGQINYVSASGVTITNVNQLFKSNGINSVNSIVSAGQDFYILGGDLTE